MLAAVFAALGFLASFAITPTVFECKLFTECHELSPSFTIVSLFSSDASTTLANEQAALQIAHSIALTAIFLLLGWVVGFAIQWQRWLALSPQAPAATPSYPSREREAESLELTGLNGFSEYYLKVGSAELVDMPYGLSIGRDADFAVSDETISREHARLRFERGKFILEDIGSTNGTTINGRNLRSHQPARLGSGDRVVFGSVAFSVRTI